MNWPVGEIARALGTALHVRGDLHWYELTDEATGAPLRLELDPRRRLVRLCVEDGAPNPLRRAGACRTELVVLPRVRVIEVFSAPRVVRVRSNAEPRTELRVSARGSWQTAPDALDVPVTAATAA